VQNRKLKVESWRLGVGKYERSTTGAIVCMTLEDQKLEIGRRTPDVRDGTNHSEIERPNSEIAQLPKGPVSFLKRPVSRFAE
jgi:hypothetical protein